jgi:hypothetical protein
MQSLKRSVIHAQVDRAVSKQGCGQDLIRRTHGAGSAGLFMTTKPDRRRCQTSRWAPLLAIASSAWWTRRREALRGL